MMFFLNHGFRVVAHVDVVTGDRPIAARTMIWITMPMMPRPWSSNSIFEMQSMSATRLAAARLRATWLGMGRAGR